jgi:4-hydroxybenzoate polyprenyltransferase
MAWVDCMRWRRAASIVRGVGWGLASLIFCTAAAATFTVEAPDALAITLCAASSLLVLGITYGISWLIDRRGDRLVTR